MANKSVTIFGAGVAGLTAAHELVERGFQVEVIDRDIREEIHSLTYDRGIGGMARSQWAWRLRKSGSTPRPMDPLRKKLDALTDDVIVFNPEGHPLDRTRAKAILDRVKALLDELAGQKRGYQLNIIAPTALPPSDGTFDPRVKYVWQALGLSAPADPPDPRHPKVVYAGLTTYQVPSPTLPLDMGAWIFFRVTSTQVFPAEHGFRFFPSFYRHLFDTLRKIPILNPRPHERTHATVMDNLVASEVLGFARNGDHRSISIPRSEIRSVEAARKVINELLKNLGYELEDMHRFGTKVIEYMTSSRARREGRYEIIDWSTFVDITAYSKVSRRHIEYGPQMLAALRGSKSDARTQGSISVQLLMDQFRTDGQPDCTLNGPTSSAWLDHWHDYLRKQGVVFRRDVLAGFTVKNQVVEPVLASNKPTNGAYCLLALSLPGITKAAESFLAACKAGGLPAVKDFEKIVAMTGGSAKLAKDLERDVPDGPLQHLSGIQFYFDVELSFWRGHTQYLDSEWGLTSVAQPQFWGRPRDTTDAYRSVLSVDIGIWDVEYNGKTAWKCTPEELAAGVWQQIVDGHNDAFKKIYGRTSSLPVPIAYAIDSNIDTVAKTDITPFLVNRVGKYRDRPGAILIGDKEPKLQSAYVVHLNKYVLAGTYMQTYTRLTSMEGANESARHAVNALLAVARVPGDHCQIWDPEDNELPDLQWLKDLDEKLFHDKKRHMLEILDIGYSLWGG